MKNNMTHDILKNAYLVTALDLLGKIPCVPHNLAPDHHAEIANWLKATVEEIQRKAEEYANENSK